MGDETEIARSIRETLTLAGYVVFRVQSGGTKVGARYIRFAPSGTPDIVGYDKKSGKFIGIEVKTAHGKPSKEQLEFIALAASSGCRVGIARTPAEALAIASGDELPKGDQ